jgi:cytochrome bd-type quinol oxidase subunit 2
METNKHTSQKAVRNSIRFSLLLLVFPLIYTGTWFFITTKESLSYFEKVQLLMSYFPPSMRHPQSITLAFFGMSLIAAILSFSAYLKTSKSKARYVAIFTCCLATLLCALYGFTML